MARTKGPALPEVTNNGRTYVGVDNGVSGSIGWVTHNGTDIGFMQTPTRSCLNYTKEAKNVTRIDVVELERNLAQLDNPFVVLERPMVNPSRFQATASALRALEATLIVLERMDIPYIYVDSKQWQKVMLPNGVKGSDALKKASLDIGRRLFPNLRHLFKGDADGLLMAEWARRNNL